MMYRSMVLICTSNVGGKYCLAGIETLTQSPAHRMDTRETPAAKAVEAAAPRENPEIYVL